MCYILFMSSTIFFPPIGLCGAAGVGKDTLCNFLIDKIPKAKRYSIAGDFIKKDLDSLLKEKISISAFTSDPLEKQKIRPLLVEYGRLMRNQTKGRYFIDKLDQTLNFCKTHIPIITDIRYAEYEKDELFWIKKQKNGLLIYLERDGIENANKFEKDNNKILKKKSDLYFHIKNTKNFKKVFEPIAEKILEEYKKISTTFQ
jgi:hypothetical protein